MTPGARGRAPSRLVAAALMGWGVALLAQAAGPVALEVRPKDPAVSPTAGDAAELKLDAAPGVTYLAETTLGVASAVEEKREGKYHARLALPASDTPRVAIVALTPQDSDDADLAFAVLPVMVRTTLTARTEPRARVLARVGAREFGPVEARRDGTFELPLELMPGDASAEVRITDAAGNSTLSKLPIPRRGHDPLLVSVDRHRAPSDGTAPVRVFALTIDDAGRPIPGARLSGSASAGDFGPFEDRGNGLHVARWTPPADGSQGIVTLEVTLGQGEQAARETEQVSLVRGRPASLVLAATPLEVVAGSGQEIRLVATALDAAKHPLPGLPVRMLADRGTLADVVDAGDGTYSSRMVTPDAVESGSIEVKALLATVAPARPPARLELSATPQELPTSWRAFSLITAKVLDDTGRPVAGEIVQFRLIRGQGRLTPASVSLAEGQAFADFTADPTAEVVVLEAACASAPSLSARVEIEKKSSGQFAIVTRPAGAAQGGQGAVSIAATRGEKVLQDSVLIAVRSGAPTRLVARAEPARLRADGVATSTITALLTDERGNEVLDQTLTWSFERGSLAPATTDGEGGYEAVFTAPDGAGSGSVPIVVSHPDTGLSATVTIALDPGPPRAIALAVEPGSLPADGASRARLTATLTDGSGAPVPGEDVSFSAVSGEAEVGGGARSDGSGRASVEVMAGSRPGTVALQALAGDLSATTTLELLPLGPDAMEVTASPAQILADGRDRSEIAAKLEDAMGELLEGETVELTTSAGTLSAQRATSDASGIARAYLSGLQPGTATVRVRPLRAPALLREVAVTLLPAGGLAATFDVAEPACSGAVTLTATSDAATAWSWDWTGDGVADATTRVAVADLPAGSASVTLEARDAAGRAEKATRVVTVRPSPAAVATARPAMVASGASVTLDAAGSASADGSALTYSWDLDGDGASDATGPTASWTAPDGVREATLTVTDAAGCSATARAPAIFGESPDLGIEVSIAGGGSAVHAGEVITFDLAWRNEGTLPAAGVTISAALVNVEAITPLPGGGQVLADGSISLALGTLAPGSAGSFSVRARATTEFTGESVTGSLSATIAGSPGEVDTSDDSDQAFVLITREIDLDVTLEAPASAAPGSEVSLLATVRNLTPASAPESIVSLRWDPALLGQVATDLPALMAADHAEIALGALPGLGAITVRLTGRIPGTVDRRDPALLVSASAWHAGPDAQPANNAASASVAIPAGPNLAIALEATPSVTPLVPGATIELRASYRNDGPAPALGVLISHEFSPALVEALVSNPDRGLLHGSQLTFDLGTLAPHETGVKVATVRLAGVIDAADRSLLDRCTITDAEATIDPPPVDTVATLTLPVEPGAPDLRVTLSLPASTAAGETISATVTLTNAGTRATGVDLNLQLAGALVTASGSNLPLALNLPGDPCSVRANIGTIEAATSLTWRLDLGLACPQAQVNPTLAATAFARRDGIVSGAPATGSVAVTALPDLALALPAPATARPGESVQVAPLVTNVGCAPAPGAVVNATWPAEVAAGSPGRSVAGGIAPGLAVTLAPWTLSVNAIQASTSNTAVIDAVLTPAGPDASASNDSARCSILVAAAPDIAVTAPASSPRADAGQSVDVTVTVDNARGSTAASDVAVTLVPADASLIVSVSPSSVTLPSVPAGASVPATFRVTAAATLPSGVSSAALTAAAATAGDLNASNDAATFPALLGAAPDLEVSLALTSFPSPARPGALVTAEATVTNHGTMPSAGSTLTVDVDPAVLASLGGAPTTVAIGALAVGGSITTAFQFTVADPLPAGVASTTVSARAEEPADVNPADNVATASIIVDPGTTLDAGVAVTLDAPSPLGAGDSVLVTIRVTNAGARPATGVTLTLSWPDALATAASFSPGGAASGGRIAWSGLDIAGNEPGMFLTALLTLPASLPAASNPMPIAAALTMDPVANPQVNLANDSAAASLVATAAAQPCVSLAASTQPTPAAEGGTVTYSLIIENRGTTAATPCTVTLEVDPRLSAAGGTQWTLPSLAAGASATLSSRFTFPALAPGQDTASYLARARADAPQAAPPDACQATPDVEVIVTRLADLAIAKTLVSSTQTPPRRDSTLSYRLTVTNRGAQAATIANVTDDFPAEVAVVSAGGAAESGGVLTWTGLPALDPLRSLTLDYSVRVDSGLPPGDYLLRNVARVTSAGADASASNDTASVDVPMPLDADLVTELAATPEPAPAMPGSIIRYDATVTNRGAYDATNARLAIDLGPLATLSGPSPGSGTGPIDVALGTIAPGATASVVTWRVTSDAVMPAEQNAVTITVAASSDVPDARPGNETASATVMVDARADLMLHDLDCAPAGGAPLDAGERLDCTVTVDNHGTLIVSGASLDMTFDPSLASVAVAGPFTPSGAGRLVAALPVLTPGSSPVTLAFSLAALPILPAEQNLLHLCGTVRSAFVDAHLPDNTRCLDVLTLGTVDIAVTLSVSAPTTPAAPGQTLTHDLSVVNRGSTAASSVLVIDDRDETLTTSLLPGATPDTITDDGARILIPVGALAAGGTFTASYQVGLAATMPAPNVNVATTACATLLENDASPGNDCASASVAVRATVDTLVELSAVTAPPWDAGQRATMRALWANQGQAPARGATVDVTLPALVDFASCSGCTRPAPGTLRFGPFDLAPAATGAATFDVTVKSPLPEAVNTLTFSAAIVHADPAAESGPGPGTANLSLAARAFADLLVTLARTSPSPATPVTPGSSMTLRAAWTNQGTTTARAVRLAITDPAHATPVGLPANAVLTLPDLAPGDLGGRDLDYTVDSTFPSTSNTLTTSVAISTTTPEQGVGPNAASWSDVVTARPNMWTRLAVSAPTNPATACGPLTATIDHGNSGQAAAAADLVLEYDPMLLDVVDAAGGAVSAGEIRWTFASVAAGSSSTLAARFAFKCVLPSLLNTALFTARISTPSADLDLADNTSAAQALASATPDLIASTRLISAMPVAAGRVLVFESAVTNAGHTAATSVQLEARWQDAALIASARCLDDPTCSVSGNVVTWSLGTVPVTSGAPVTRRVELTVAAALPAVTNALTITTSATALEPDANPGNNSASAVATLVGAPDLQLTLTSSPAAGTDISPSLSFVRYSYAVRNVGSAPAQDVSISASFDAQALTFLFATGAGTVSGNQLTFAPVPSLAPGASVSPVRAALFSPNDLAPPPVARTINHSALAQEGAPLGLTRDANPADNSGSVALRGCYLDAYIKSGSLTAICVGGTNPPGSVSLTAKTNPSNGLTYAWSSEGSLGTFSSLSAQSTTYTPPDVDVSATYRVHCLVTDIATGCQVDAIIDIATTTACESCGCRPNPVKLRYTAGTLSRLDRPGDRVVAETESVAFTVRVAELNMSRSSTLLAGRSTMTFGRSGAGPRYTAVLANDAYVECGGANELEFVAAEVPAGLAVGGLPTDYKVSFVWVTRDGCARESTDNDDSGTDNVTVTAAALLGANPGITFTDWGPQRGP